MLCQIFNVWRRVVLVDREAEWIVYLKRGMSRVHPRDDLVPKKIIEEQSDFSVESRTFIDFWVQLWIGIS